MRLWGGQTISEFGSWLGALSLLAILVLDATPAQMGITNEKRTATSRKGPRRSFILMVTPPMYRDAASLYSRLGSS